MVPDDSRRLGGYRPVLLYRVCWSRRQLPRAIPVEMADAGRMDQGGAALAAWMILPHWNAGLPPVFGRYGTGRRGGA